MTQQITLLPVKSIEAGNNDRTRFDQNELKNLSDSIFENGKGIEGEGLIQPITVNWISEGHYQIVAGERRYRACKLLGWSVIPAIIVKLTPDEASALMLVENVSRVDLDPIDEARAYKIRIDKLEWTVERCAKSAGVSAIRIRFRLKLLDLREDLQDLIRTNNLPIGYAQILADASLDTNRQLLAVANLQKNPKPTTGWFRNIVGQYKQQQDQAGLFDTNNFLVCQEMPIENNTEEPPHPSTTTPPVIGRSASAIIKNQIKFWTEAALQWEQIGKPFKKQECQSAAQALTYAVSQI